jgi:Myb-like DNA-binding domain
VQEHGEGRWTAILKAGGGTFASRSRTAVDLKDKWRNLARASERAANGPARPAIDIIQM